MYPRTHACIYICIYICIIMYIYIACVHNHNTSIWINCTFYQSCMLIFPPGISTLRLRGTLGSTGISSNGAGRGVDACDDSLGI